MCPGQSPSSTTPTVKWRCVVSQRFYGIKLASSSGGPVESSSGIAVETQRVGEVSSRAVDSLLVAGAEREPLRQAMVDKAIRAALPRIARKARRFGSVCTGAFILAAIGLIGDRRVTTHWDGCASLAEAFPAVSVDPDALYVEDGQLWTSAGVTTGIDMALAMVARDLGAAIAGEVAKRLVLYARRPGFQSQFSPLLRAQARADNPFAELIGWIQANLDASLDVATLAARAGLSERTFHRRFATATGETPARFVEKARLDGRPHAALARRVAEIRGRAGGAVSGHALFRGVRTTVRHLTSPVSRDAR